MKLDFKGKLLNELLKDNLDGIVKIICNQCDCLLNITDESFNVLSLYPKEYINEPIWDSYVAGIPLSLDIIKMLNENQLIEKGYTTDKPYIIHINEDCGYKRVGAKIYKNNVVYGYMTAYFKNEIKYEDMNYLTIAQDVISYYMSNKLSVNDQNANIYDLFMTNLFNDNIRNKEEVDKWEELLHTTINGPFCLVCTNNIKYSFALQIVREIRNQYNYYFCYITNEQLYFLVCDIERNLDNIISLLNNYDLSVGISNSFDNLDNINKYKLQALYSATIKTDNKIHYFIDYSLAIMIDKLSQKDLYVHPIFDILKKYDQENNYEYLPTLIAYLENGGSHIAIEKQLKVHRNTIYNRIKMIEEIAGIDLSNAETFCQLYISLLIVKNEQQESC